MFWLAPTKTTIDYYDCRDTCQTEFSHDGIQIFSYLAEDDRSCACLLCPEDYFRNDKLKQLLSLMGCKDFDSLKRRWYQDALVLLAYYCKLGGSTKYKRYG